MPVTGARAMYLLTPGREQTATTTLECVTVWETDSWNSWEVGVRGIMQKAWPDTHTHTQIDTYILAHSLIYTHIHPGPFIH